MRLRVLLPPAVLTLVGAAAVVSPLHRIAAPVGHTGGFGEPTCVACHLGDEANSYGGTVALQGLPEAYEPGASYVLSVVLRMEETVAAGFQMTARYAEGPRSGSAAGTVESLDARVAITVSETGQSYAHHTEPGSHVADASGSSWTVQWIAPSNGGPVTFHLAANSANGDNSPLADLIYTHAVTVPVRTGRD